eukprot:3708446-Pleurochrysis_carterae.AAC.1
MERGLGRACAVASGASAPAGEAGHARAVTGNIESGARALHKYACGADPKWETMHASTKQERMAMV